MELRHMRYFVAVAETLNLRKAAQRLHISPPPLTVQIRDLETEIGTELLSRKSKGRRLELTDAGRVFLERARQMLAQADESVTLARRAASGEIGQLSIGHNIVAELSILPRIMPALQKRWPSVHIMWHSMRTPQQARALSEEELDLGLLCPPVAADDALDLEQLTEQPFVAVLPAKHRLAAAATVSWQSLSDEPLILHSRMLDPESFRKIEHQFSSVGAVMHVACELESSLSMLSMVAAGTGCSILPEYVRGLGREGIICRPLEPPSIVRTLAVAKRKGRNGLVDSIYRFVVETVTAVPQPHV